MVTILDTRGLERFEFYGPAEENFAKLSLSQIAELERYYEETYPEGIEGGKLNDDMSYYFESYILPILGFETEEELEEANTLIFD